MRVVRVNKVWICLLLLIENGSNLASSNPKPKKLLHLLDELSTKVHETWGPQIIEKAQPFLANYVQGLFKTILDPSRCYEPQKRRKRGANEKSPTSSPFLSNRTITTFQSSFLEPFVAAVDILARSPLVNTNPVLLVLVLAIRTVLAIIHGGLNCMRGDDCDVMQTVRNRFP